MALNYFDFKIQIRKINFQTKIQLIFWFNSLSRFLLSKLNCHIVLIFLNKENLKILISYSLEINYIKRLFNTFYIKYCVLL